MLYLSRITVRTLLIQINEIQKIDKLDSLKNDVLKQIQDNLKLLKREASTKGFRTALVITVTTQSFINDIEIFPFRYFGEYVCLPIGIKNHLVGQKIAKLCDGKIEVIFVDAENKLFTCENVFDKIFHKIKKTKVYPIKGNDFTADSAFSTISAILKNVTGKKIIIVGSGNIGSKLALKLTECGAQVFILNSTKLSSSSTARVINQMKPIECRAQTIPATVKKIPKNLDCIVGFTRGIPVITEEIVSNLKKDGLLLDGGTGTVSESGIIESRCRNIKVLRLDIRLGFAYYASLILNTENFIADVVGEREINGVHIVAGGFIGKKGDIIVDKIKKPTKIIGVSNGKGGIQKYDYNHKNTDIIKRLIN